MPQTSSQTAELIAFLNVLHPGNFVFSPRDFGSRDSIQRSLYDEWGRVLPFVVERELVETLAFLANTDISLHRAVAVAIAEEAVTKLRVAVAVNINKLGDGASVLETVKLGFDRIFKTLSKVHNGE